MELNKNHDRSNTNNTTSTNANNDSTVNRNKNETKSNNTFQALQSPNMNAHMHPINSPLPPKSVKKTPTTEKLDDIFSLICSKMGNLSTDGSGNKTEMVDAFVSVLMCSESEANFFLESTNWDVASVSCSHIVTYIIYFKSEYICIYRLLIFIWKIDN